MSSKHPIRLSNNPIIKQAKIPVSGTALAVGVGLLLLSTTIVWYIFSNLGKGPRFIDSFVLLFPFYISRVLPAFMFLIVFGAALQVSQSLTNTEMRHMLTLANLSRWDIYMGTVGATLIKLHPLALVAVGLLPLQSLIDLWEPFVIVIPDMLQETLLFAIPASAFATRLGIALMANGLLLVLALLTACTITLSSHHPRDIILKSIAVFGGLLSLLTLRNVLRALLAPETISSSYRDVMAAVFVPHSYALLIYLALLIGLCVIVTWLGTLPGSQRSGLLS